MRLFRSDDAQFRVLSSLQARSRSSRVGVCRDQRDVSLWSVGSKPGESEIGNMRPREFLARSPRGVNVVGFVDGSSRDLLGAVVSERNFGNRRTLVTSSSSSSSCVSVSAPSQKRMVSVAASPIADIPEAPLAQGWKQLTTKIRSAVAIKAFLEIGDRIGTGSYGIVHCAKALTDLNEDVGAGDELALKKINKRVQPQYKSEILLPARVRDSSVLRPKKVFETDTDVFLMTELLRGGELFDVVAEYNMYRKTLSERTVLKITREMLVALEACHKNNLAHLDVKPENFMLRVPWELCMEDEKKMEGNLVLVDFGAAQPFKRKSYASTSDQYEVDMDDDFTGQKILGGTASYVSPEVLHGKFSSRSDLWSLGVCLFMLIAGRRPFDDINIDAPSPTLFDRKVSQRVKSEAALPLGKSLYSTCEELGLAHTSTVDLLLTMMHPEPRFRRSATELIARIDTLLNNHHSPN